MFQLDIIQASCHLIHRPDDGGSRDGSGVQEVVVVATNGLWCKQH